MRPVRTGMDAIIGRHGQPVLSTPEVFIYWKRETGVVSVVLRGGRNAAAEKIDWSLPTEVRRPTNYSFSGKAAEDFLTVCQVGYLRGGVNGLRDALREVFDPRGEYARGMFFAELQSYRRVNGRIVRDMEG